MGRRSSHTQEELRQLILDAATELVKTSGIDGLSAREIAREIHYSPGTLYNVFDNLDELILVVEGRLLDQLVERLRAQEPGTTAREHLAQLGQAYLRFAQDNPKQWNLLFEHHLPDGRVPPEWYREKFDSLVAEIEGAVACCLNGADKDAVKRHARVIWAGIHGLAAMSTAGKLTPVNPQCSGEMVSDLINTHLDGISAIAPSRGGT